MFGITLAVALLAVSPAESQAAARNQYLVQVIDIQRNPRVALTTGGVVQPFLGESNVIRVREEYRGVKAESTLGMLTVLGQQFSRGTIASGIWWSCVCRCECGAVFVGDVARLTKTPDAQCKSCAGRESATIKHGLLLGAGDKRPRLYRIWTGMKSRCSNPKTEQWPRYGGRGITVCEEWSGDFVAFRDWSLENGYADDLEIDRRDNDGPYSPGNCRWVSCEANGRNRGNNHWLTAFGETKVLAEWLQDSRCSIVKQTLLSRLSLGWDAERAIATPARPKAAKGKA